jgi:hypothetical protein
VLAGDVRSFATSGGVTETGAVAHPYFFTGFLAEPGPAARALLGGHGRSLKAGDQGT